MLKPQPPSVYVCAEALHCSSQWQHPLATCSVRRVYGIPAGIKGGTYSFDTEKGPDEIFARFFGTLNPYEALQGECACLQQQADALPLGPGTSVALQLHAPLHDSCLCMHQEVPNKAWCRRGQQHSISP